MSAKKEKKLPNPEAYERINYLLGISYSTILLAFQALPAPKNVSFHTDGFLKRKLKDSIELSRSYIKTLREVAKKSVIRL